MGTNFKDKYFAQIHYNWYFIVFSDNFANLVS
jgi:hypothetical protein